MYLLLYAVIIAAYVCTCESDDCNDAYSCAFNSSISDSTECIGYYSCAFSKSMIVNTNSSCDGAFSCFNLSSITINQEKTTTNATDVKLYSNGLYSCANNKNITSNLFTDSPSETTTISISINCYGELSCRNSWITNTISRNYESYTKYLRLNCAADRSCADSVVSLTGPISKVLITLSGYLSAQNTIFTIHTIKQIFYHSAYRFDFVARSSSQNTSIRCNSTAMPNSVTVYINCYSNGCDGMTFSSVKHSCTFNVTCYDATISDACPQGFNLNSHIYTKYFVKYGNGIVPNWPELYTQNGHASESTNSYSYSHNYNYMYNYKLLAMGTNFNNSAVLCHIPQNMSSVKRASIANSSQVWINTGPNNTYPINCGNYKECIGDMLTTKRFIDTKIDHISVPICCTAGNSCAGAANISLKSPSNDSIIRCDGAVSCQNATLDIVLSNIDNHTNSSNGQLQQYCYHCTRIRCQRLFDCIFSEC